MMTITSDIHHTCDVRVVTAGQILCDVKKKYHVGTPDSTSSIEHDNYSTLHIYLVKAVPPPSTAEPQTPAAGKAR